MSNHVSWLAFVFFHAPPPKKKQTCISFDKLFEFLLYKTNWIDSQLHRCAVPTWGNGHQWHTQHCLVGHFCCFYHVETRVYIYNWTDNGKVEFICLIEALCLANQSTHLKKKFYKFCFRYSCNRYDEKDSLNAREAQTVSFLLLVKVFFYTYT